MSDVSKEPHWLTQRVSVGEAADGQGRGDPILKGFQIFAAKFGLDAIVN